MRYLYFLTAHGIHSGVLNKRVDAEHRCVYHGAHMFLGEDQSPQWQEPSLSNSNRERMHIFRSGSFVPSVFSPSAGLLVVSEEVKNHCRGLIGIEFQPVVFERLVEMQPPPIGKCDSTDLMTPSDLRKVVEQLPDVQAYHDSIGDYFSVLMPSYAELYREINDAKKIKLNFGRYYNEANPTVTLAPSILVKHSMYHAEGGYWCMTEYAFEKFAPYLNLDFYVIDMIALDSPLSE